MNVSFQKKGRNRIRLRTRLLLKSDLVKNDILSGSSGVKNFRSNRVGFINHFNYHHSRIHLLNKRIDGKLFSGGALRTFKINDDVAYSNYRLKLAKVETK